MGLFRELGELPGVNGSHNNTDQDPHGESRIFTAVLFPWFVQMLGVVTNYIMTRL